jgi:hypothetical protein
VSVGDGPTPIRWGGGIDDPTDWRDVVLSAASAADAAVERAPGREKLLALIVQHSAAPKRPSRGWVDWDGEVNDYSVELFDRAVLLGFALARTWPTSPEGMAEWPIRALEHAELIDEEPTQEATSA